MEDDTMALVERARCLTQERVRLTRETRRLILQSESLQSRSERAQEDRLLVV